MSQPAGAPLFGPRLERRQRPLQGFVPAFTWGLRVTLGRRRRLVMVALLGALVGLLVGTQGLGLDRGPLGKPDRVLDLWEALDTALLRFVIPLVALVMVAGGFQREVSERTLVFHLVRPISRRTLFVARYVAGTLLAVPMALVPVWTAMAFSGVRLPLQVWGSALAAVALGVLSTGAIYYLLAAWLRFGTIAGLVYTFVIDAFLQGASGTMQMLSATYYVRSVHHGLSDAAFGERSAAVLARLAEHGAPSEDELLRGRLAIPDAARIDWIPADQAALVLLALSAAVLALGLLLVSRRDYALKE
jgi:hypothetical protein